MERRIGDIIDTGDTLIGERQVIIEYMIQELKKQFDECIENAMFENLEDFIDNMQRTNDLLNNNEDFMNIYYFDLCKVKYDNDYLGYVVSELVEKEKEN